MDTLGIVECRGIAAGVAIADGMMKVADVTLVRAGTICSGRYMIYVSGDRSAVSASVEYARETGSKLRGSFVISNVSSDVLGVLRKDAAVDAENALGVVECRCVSSGIVAADVALKRSAITLAKIVAGQGINGKSYFVISGDVASVREAVEAAETALDTDLVEAVVIPRPDASVVNTLVRGVR